ncbi:MAG: nucleotidyltransferase family protein [Saprospiraceae bacterium]
MVNAILLAAGLSARMGKSNKLLLPYHHTTILATTLSHLRPAKISKLVVVLGHDEEKVSKGIGSYKNVDIVYNDLYKTGQVSSMKVGVDALDSHTPFMIALGDMPLITTQNYNELIQAFIGENINKPTILRPYSTSNKPGNPVLFDHSFINDFLANDDLYSSKNIIEKNKNSLVNWKTDIPPFFHDVDTLEDYEKLISSGS